ncbi:MAG: metallophosphoesterase [Proteobacteria bacterium]|nr:metallophosphoesterase [Pseudomonadota bacterium]
MKLKITLLVLFLIPNFSSASTSDLLSKEPINNPNKEKFMFLINSDPQMGDEHTVKPGLKTLNELLEMFVEETNKRKAKNKPDFVVWAGDLVWDPFQNAFDNFQRIVKKMKIPSVLVHGNHDGYNGDPKFLNLQENLSGYRKLNYSFGYGKWHFVVISAQEKYLKPEQKKAMLKWLDDELKQNKDKQTMLFMHYHILPTGLSQMEFYTYFPMDFKNEMLDTIIRYNNVKYVFSGHVHIGIKASIKTARNYKGTNFILAPTPVFARPFGEEYPKFREKGSKYDRRGFYSEVHVNGDEVQIIGRKIHNKHKVKYPKTFKKFDASEDLRAFTPEGKLKVNDVLINGSFDTGLEGWKSSWRYKRDKKTGYKNYVSKGQSMLRYFASYGSWNFEEYMENYQSVKYKDDMHVTIDFSLLPSKFKGGGGYFRIFAYDKEGILLKILLFHWGTQEEKVSFMQQSWAYNATGDRHSALWLDKKIQKGDMLSYELNIAPLTEQKLEIELNQLFEQISNNDPNLKINHVTIAYGVWGRVTPKGRKFFSSLNVDEIKIVVNDKKKYSSNVILNNETVTKLDTELKFGYRYKRDKKSK